MSCGSQIAAAGVNRHALAGAQSFEHPHVIGGPRVLVVDSSRTRYRSSPRQDSGDKSRLQRKPAIEKQFGKRNFSSMMPANARIPGALHDAISSFHARSRHRAVGCPDRLRAPLARGAGAPVDWKQQEPEILRHYRALVQLDTSSPPGNETRAVDYLKKVFEKPKASRPRRSRSIPKRANLVARIKGNGTKRPILLMSAHRRRRRAAREVAGRSVRRGDEGRLRLGTRHARRQGQPGRESHDHAAAEAQRRDARSRRHLPGRVGRGGRSHGRRHPLHGEPALRRDRRRIRAHRRRRRRRSKTAASRVSTSRPPRKFRAGSGSSRRARPGTAPSRASTTR